MGQIPPPDKLTEPKFCFFLNHLHPKLRRDKLLSLVIGLALVWHVGLALFEHYKLPKCSRVPLSKLLLTAEVEVLQTLRSELVRRGHRGQAKGKLEEVDRRLEEIENRGHEETPENC